MSTGAGLGALFGAILGAVFSAIIPGLGTFLGIYIGATIGYSVGMMIDPATPDIKAAGAPLQGLQITSNTIGTPIPDALGTTKIAGFLLAYGAERAVPQVTTTGGGKGGSKKQRQITGHKYYMSWALGICKGQIDTLYTIFENEKVVWEGEVNRPGSGGEETIVIPNFGSVTLYFGTNDQMPNPKMAGIITDPTLNSPLRELCWAFFDDYYIGDFNRMPTMFFVFKKKPVITFSAVNEISVYDYNPMHTIWYILHDLTGLPESWLHPGDFSLVADTLFSESRGISILIDQYQSARTYIESICNHIDGMLRYGSDGTFHPKLLRDDYNPALLPIVDESIILEEPTVARKSWIDTMNEVKVQYSEITGRPLVPGELIIQISIDTYLHKQFPDNNYVSNSLLQVYGSNDPYVVHTAIRIDFTALPVGAVITSAILSLYLIFRDITVGPYTVHELSRKDWVPGEATWNRYKAGSLWSAAGGDYEGTIDAPVVVPNPPNWMNFDITELIKHFQADHGKIADILIRDTIEGNPAEGGTNFYSNEWGSAIARPKLTINYGV